MRLNSLRIKLILTISIALIIVFGTIISYFIIINRNRSIKSAEKELVLLAEKYALKIQAEIEIAMDATNTMASTFNALKKTNIEKFNRNDINEVLKKVLFDTPNFLASYTLWMPNAFDGKDKNFINKIGHDATGRFIPYWTRDEKGEFVLEPLVDYMQEGAGNYFQIPKKTQKEVLLEPYIYPVQGKDVLITSIVTPVLINNEFKAIAGIDITIDFLQNYAQKAKLELYDGHVDISIIANNGTYAANTMETEKVGKNISENNEDTDTQLKWIKKGKNKIVFKNDNIEIYVPISVGKTTTFWQFCITTPEDIIYADANNQMWVLIFMGILLILIGLTVINFVISNLIKPLLKLVITTREIAKGNLTVKIESNQKDDIAGELAKSFNAMIDKLKEIINSIKTNIENVSGGSIQISKSSQQIAQGANEQAASIEEISSSIEEMVASINQNTENTQETEKMAIKSEQGILEGQKASNKTMEAMHNIAEKIMVINKIAEKTDLLAINAAIEASRAGEFGKSFAVVASEVRKLAENSQKSAKEIIELTSSSVKIAEYSENILKETVKDVQKTAVLIQEVTQASIEQNSNANQINKAIQEFNMVVQQNTSTSEELSTGADEIASQSLHLKNVVSFFNLDENMSGMKEIENDLIKYVSKMFKKKNNKHTGDFEINIKSKNKEIENKKTNSVKINLDDMEDSEFENF